MTETLPSLPCCSLQCCSEGATVGGDLRIPMQTVWFLLLQFPSLFLHASRVIRKLREARCGAGPSWDPGV